MRSCSIIPSTKHPKRQSQTRQSQTRPSQTRHSQTRLSQQCRRVGTAFSLIELTLVMSIMAVLCAIAMPRYASSLANYRARAAAKRISSDLAQLQSYARTSSTARTISFNRATSIYQIANLRDMDSSANTYFVNLTVEPYNASISTLSFGGNATLSFDGYGNPSSGGSITVQSGNSTRIVSVDANTGKVTVQ